MKNLENEGGNVSSSDLRLALASVYAEYGKFQLQEYEDACEAFQALLNALHSQVIDDITQGLDRTASNTPCRCCPAHEFFNLQVCEQIYCNSCGASSEVKPWDYCTFLQSLYVNEFICMYNHPESGILKHVDQNSLSQYKDKSNILKLVGTLQYHLLTYVIKIDPDARCPETPSICKSAIRKRLNLMSSPRIYVLNLVWSEKSPSLINILKVLASVPYELDLSKIYDEESCTSQSKYLKGMICYGMAHYISYFLNDRGEWIKYDDVIIRKVNDGEQYDMIYDILAGRFHPVMVFYTEEKCRNSHLKASDIHWLALEKYAMLEDEIYEAEKLLLKEYEEKMNARLDTATTLNPGTSFVEPTNEPVYSQPSYTPTYQNMLSETPPSFLSTWKCDYCATCNDKHSSVCKACNISLNRVKLPAALTRSSQVHAKGAYSTFDSINAAPLISRNIPVSSSANNLPSKTNSESHFKCFYCEKNIPSDQLKYCPLCNINFYLERCISAHGDICVICKECKEASWLCISCGKNNLHGAKYCGLCKRIKPISYNKLNS